MCFCDDDGCGVPFVVVLILILVCRRFLALVWGKISRS